MNFKVNTRLIFALLLCSMAHTQSKDCCTTKPDIIAKLNAETAKRDLTWYRGIHSPDSPSPFGPFPSEAFVLALRIKETLDMLS